MRVLREAIEDGQTLAELSRVQVALAGCDEITFQGDRTGCGSCCSTSWTMRSSTIIRADASGLALRRCAQGAEFSVVNTGPGIPAEKVPRVFERFFRGDASHNQSPEGCGLGLSIASGSWRRTTEPLT